MNVNGNPVVWAVNDTTANVTTSLDLQNTGLNGPLTLTHFQASATNNASSPRLSETRIAIDGRITTSVTLPPKSVYGVIVNKPTVPRATESIFGGLSSPSVWSDGNSWELGTRFTPSVSGQVPAIKVFSSSQESGPHTARIWNNSTGTVVGGPYSLTYGGIGGWTSHDLPAPVNLTAGTEYTVTVTTGADASRTMPHTTASATTAGSNGRHLTYPANAGVASTILGSRPTFSNGNNYLRDVVFVPTGRVNLAFGKVTTASSSYGIGFEASKAVDGKYFADDIGNTWASGAAHVGSWWKVDLGSARSVRKVRVQFRGYPTPAGSLVFQQVPKNITFQVSNDNTNWTTVVNRSPNVPGVGAVYGQQLYDYSMSTSGRYVRLLFDDGSQGGDHVLY